MPAAPLRKSVPCWLLCSRCSSHHSPSWKGGSNEDQQKGQRLRPTCSSHFTARLNQWSNHRPNFSRTAAEAPLRLLQYTSPSSRGRRGVLMMAATIFDWTLSNSIAMVGWGGHLEFFFKSSIPKQRKILYVKLHLSLQNIQFWGFGQNVWKM